MTSQQKKKKNLLMLKCVAHMFFDDQQLQKHEDSVKNNVKSVISQQSYNRENTLH